MTAGGCVSPERLVTLGQWSPPRTLRGPPEPDPTGQPLVTWINLAEWLYVLKETEMLPPVCSASFLVKASLHELKPEQTASDDTLDTN